MIHTRLPRSQQWILRICPTLALRLVSRHGRNSQMQFASRRRLLQIALPVRCFLRSLKRWQSVGRIPGLFAEWSITYQPYRRNQSEVRLALWGLVTSIPLDYIRSIRLASDFTADADVKQAVLRNVFLMCRYRILGAMVGQMLKCQLWLSVSLICTICYPCATYRLHRIQGGGEYIFLEFSCKYNTVWINENILGLWGDCLTELNILECNAKLISVVISLKETLEPNCLSNTVSHGLWVRSVAEVFKCRISTIVAGIDCHLTFVWPCIIIQ